VAAVWRVFQIAARRFDLTDSSVQMSGVIGAESRPRCGRSFPLEAAAALGRRDGLGQPRCEQRPAPRHAAGRAGAKPGAGARACARLTLPSEKTLQLFVENAPGAYDVLRSPCHGRTFFDVT